MLNSLSFCFSGHVLSMKDSFAELVFQHFKYIICLLTSLVSDEKLVVNRTEDLLYVMSCFSLAAFKILFVIQEFDYNVSQCGSLKSLSYLEFMELLGFLDL